MIVVDGSHLMHRVLNTESIDLVNSKGVKVGGVHGFLRSLAKLTNLRMNTEGVLVAWDLGIPLHRREIYTEYKPHKKPVGTGCERYFSGQNIEGYEEEKDIDAGEKRIIHNQSVQLLNEVFLPAIGCVSLRVPNCEADDILAMWSYKVLDAPGVIYSSDRDLIQLVTENIDFYDVLNEKYVTKDSIIEDNDYDPETWRTEFLLSKAIFGDKSDNIVGITDVGKKAAPQYARQLMDLQRSGLSLEEAFSKLERPYRGKKTGYELIKESQDQVMRNFDLMDLFLPIEQDLPMAQSIKAALCSTNAQHIDKTYLENRLDDFELYEAHRYCHDIIESNTADNLKDYLHYFI